jgi:two-component system, chemotaxis family, CheB/CheR fusion protein
LISPCTRASGRAGIWPALILGGQGNVDPKLPGPSLVSGHHATGARPHRILVIEDNVDAAETLRDYLTLHGHEVCVAHTGREGIDAAGRFLPDVILCDIGLPGMDGWDVARSIRGTPATAAARLVAVTGYGTDDDRRRSAEAGFEAHLLKPLDLDGLRALLG